MNEKIKLPFHDGERMAPRHGFQTLIPPSMSTRPFNTKMATYSDIKDIRLGSTEQQRIDLHPL